MFEPMMEMSDDAVIKVVGVGGGGVKPKVAEKRSRG